MVEAAIGSMVELNRGAAEAMLHVGVHAATDVTGYGLLGHLHEMARASRLEARVTATAVPLLPGAERLARQGHVPGGTRRNAADREDDVVWRGDVAEELRILLCDAQTSGGLLIAVAPDRVDRLLALLVEAGAPAAVVVGELVEGAPGRIVVEG